MAWTDDDKMLRLHHNICTAFVLYHKYLAYHFYIYLVCKGNLKIPNSGKLFHIRENLDRRVPNAEISNQMCFC